MPDLLDIRFTLFELPALIGVAQCLYLLVYMLFRSGRLSRAGVPSAYFFILGAAFFLDFGQGHIGELKYYSLVQTILWFAVPPLSFLLIIQIAQITRAPPLRFYTVLSLVPLSWLGAYGLAALDAECGALDSCPSLKDWMVITGLIAGALSMLAVWFIRGFMIGLRMEKLAGRERFWVVVCLMLMNAFLLFWALIALGDWVDMSGIALIRDVAGLGLVYLSTTSLFRIYPQAVRVNSSREPRVEKLSSAELELAEKVEYLLDIEKIYHEPSYGRSDMARELGVSETLLSRVINLHFDRSFPQLLNERRIEDAKRLLRQSDAPIRTVADEVGFNSLPTFYRAFKDVEGISPSEYRSGEDRGD